MKRKKVTPTEFAEALKPFKKHKSKWRKSFFDVLGLLFVFLLGCCSVILSLKFFLITFPTKNIFVLIFYALLFLTVIITTVLGLTLLDNLELLSDEIASEYEKRK